MRTVRRNNGFSLMEVMIAILFISIAFFGYVALHARIIHSGLRLEEREVIRGGTDFFSALDIGRSTLGMTGSIEGAGFHQHPNLTDVRIISTSMENRFDDWKLNYPVVYHPGLVETLEMSPVTLLKPYDYRWGTR